MTYVSRVHYQEKELPLCAGKKGENWFFGSTKDESKVTCKYCLKKLRDREEKKLQENSICKALDLLINM